LHKLARNLKGRDVDGRIIFQMDLTETGQVSVAGSCKNGNDTSVDQLRSKGHLKDSAPRS